MPEGDGFEIRTTRKADGTAYVTKIWDVDTGQLVREVEHVLTQVVHHNTDAARRTAELAHQIEYEQECARRGQRDPKQGMQRVTGRAELSVTLDVTKRLPHRSGRRRGDD
jgi:hypothetical protein